MPEIVVGPAIVVVLIVLMLIGARRQPTGHPIWGWFAHLPVLFAPAGLIVAAISQLLRGNPAIGILFLALGLILGIPALRYVSTVSTRLRTSPPGEVSDEVAGAMADYMLTRMGIMLIGAIVLGIGAVIWAIAGGFN